MITNAVNLHAQLHALGVHLEVRGRRLHYSAPEGALNDDLLIQLALYKDDLIDMIRPRRVRGHV